MCSAHAGALEVVLDPVTLDMAHFSSVQKRQLGCLDCARCGFPHLDLGAFAANEHRRHYCGNDSTHRKRPIVSNRLFALSEHCNAHLSFEAP